MEGQFKDMLCLIWEEGGQSTKSLEQNGISDHNYCKPSGPEQQKMYFDLGMGSELGNEDTILILDEQPMRENTGIKEGQEMREEDGIIVGFLQPTEMGNGQEIEGIDLERGEIFYKDEPIGEMENRGQAPIEILDENGEMFLNFQPNICNNGGNIQPATIAENQPNGEMLDVTQPGPETAKKPKIAAAFRKRIKERERAGFRAPHPDDALSCEPCCVIFQNKWALQFHIEEYHWGLSKDEPKFWCKKCSLPFKTQSYLKQHNKRKHDPKRWR